MSNSGRILVTGGAGYIGSHTLPALDEAGYDLVVLDDLRQGHREAVLAGTLEAGSLSDEPFLEDVFRRHRITAVIHFASRCYVGESMDRPQFYYEENVGNALRLLRSMRRYEVGGIVFSSSCATYGDPVTIPMTEKHPLNPVNVYGRTKLVIEWMLADYARVYGFRFVSLRYFNAAGASLDGRIGESHDPETHLIPRVLQVAGGKRDKVAVFGDDYDTEDGSCIRDYVHVVDLAAAHVLALQYLEAGESSDVFNIGAGKGSSVFEVVDAARAVTGKLIPTEVVARRPGDPPRLVAEASKAREKLKWRPRFSDLDTIMDSAWQWERTRRF